jgi:hypothetical protein
MKVTRVSSLSGNTTTRELDVTEKQLNDYERGAMTIQKAFPHLSPADREFIMTGITEEEWDEATKLEDDYE